MSSSNKKKSKGSYTFAGILCGFVAIICVAFAPIGLIGTLIFGMGAWANFANRKKFYGNGFDKSTDTPSAPIAEAKSALAASTDERQKRILSNFIEIIETTDAIAQEEKILASLNKKPDRNADLIKEHNAALATLQQKLAVTGYDVEESVSAGVLELYGEMCKSFEKLMTSQKIWIQTSKIRNAETKSSASTVVNLKVTSFNVGRFGEIKSKFKVPVIPFDGRLLYLYPEFTIIAQSSVDFAVVDYDDILVSFSAIRFNEPGHYPSDAEKIGTTWEYINKNGGPDRRYSNNRMIAVMRYGGLNVSLKGFATVAFQISNAASADDFCSKFRRFNQSIESKSVESFVPDHNEPAKTSLSQIIQASDRLFQCLVEMSTDSQVIEAIERQQQLECVRDVNIGGDLIDNRLGFVAVVDLLKCFERLGHQPDMSTDEGRAIGLLMTRIILPNNNVWNNEELMRLPDGQKVLENSYDAFKNNLHVKFDPDKFLLIEILRHEGVDEETINRWAVLLYRYALLIAKADGHLSETEQKWLTNILGFAQNNSVRTTKFESKHTSARLPANVDSLFADAARFVVSSNIGSVSSLQRRFNIGYVRAGKIMDQLEAANVVGPVVGANPRSIIMDMITLEALLSNGSSEIETVEETPSVGGDVVNEDVAVIKAKGRAISDPMKELESLIGLAGVKAEISNIYNLVRVQKLRVSKGLSAPDISYHCIFTGNPGTGKTTVARLVAQIYKKLGILSKGHLVETDRSGLVAEYVGQTAVKTNKIIDSALDGVLFIDEAYSLLQGGNDYGLEAIATLLKRMEDDRDRLVVILAGYSGEMEAFINSNPGLKSRFNRNIHFEDYSANELASIYEFYLAKFDYQMTDTALAAILEAMEEAVRQKDKNFGNARFVRNMFEKTLERQAKRLVASCLSTLRDEAITEITEEDIPSE